ncbi:MAG TPA: glutamyl-tRNA amidotransferase [Nitrospiraceae bacterium]|nr:MAG: glutamyl-tRNA amidotransferase [Nitrospirae bacterium GWA2_46_11]OGW24419.1 MAG: glutamyl-tRNA amidotransferase [Nitrospirae bacterium GWB2_47_37]HAK89503.1 glutamyl-tRNA amidotransferase [Nitrospiraceae bacterium]HCL80701.1 glutamyl-tRNA amidotransferase [Nitrospiraceae bacterium]HCZ12877.1 glutamyl-tRNA amidotransferase [Nitrospiraceae bacterium]
MPSESLDKRLDSELKEALKARDALKVSVIRMIKASLKNKAIEKMAPLTDDDTLSVLSSFAKQRRESIEQFTAAGRTDLAGKEEKELQIVQSYLPRQLSPQEIDDIIRSAISECGASSPNDMGKVMKIVSPKTKGTADGKIVSQRVKELLSSHS